MVSFIHYYFEVIIYLVELKSIDIPLQNIFQYKVGEIFFCILRNVLVPFNAVEVASFVIFQIAQH